MNFKQTVPAWLVASTALILYSSASAQKDTWCGWDFENISRMKPEKVAACLKAGASPTARDKWRSTPLHKAAMGDSAEAVKLLLEVGADPNARDKSGEAPLHRASGSAEAVKLLLGAGADPNARDKSGEAPLHRASGFAEAVKLLLGAGADPNVRDNNGGLPFTGRRREVPQKR